MEVSAEPNTLVLFIAFYFLRKDRKSESLCFPASGSSQARVWRPWVDEGRAEFSTEGLDLDSDHRYSEQMVRSEGGVMSFLQRNELNVRPQVSD